MDVPTGANTSRSQIIVRIMLAGFGLALSLSVMPIMAGGMAVLPLDIVGGGSAIADLVRRVTVAIGWLRLLRLIPSKNISFLSTVVP